MSKKNRHNANVGSDIERSDDRINETGEVFTPIELCVEMVSEIPESILKNDKSTDGAKDDDRITPWRGD